MDQPLDQPQRTLAKRELGAARGAEQIGDEREVGAGDVGEEKRRATRSDDPAMNFRGLEIRVDRRRDLDEIVVAAQPIEKRAEIGKHDSARRRRPCGALPRLVVAAAVDARHLAAHRAQIRRQLAAVMHHVHEREQHVLARRASSCRRSRSICVSLLPSQREHALEPIGEFLLVPVGDAGDVWRRRLLARACRTCR